MRSSKSSKSPVLRTLSVTFLEGYNTTKQYHYLWDGPEVMDMPDHAVVQVGQEVKLVKIRSVYAGRSSQATKYILGLVDYTKYKGRISVEQERSRILQELNCLERSLPIEVKYASLGKSLPKARKLLAQLKKLG